ncbi:unnamed protein product [Anisakis simplex]|uniref:Kinase n=1 Tax=Anisakis simplex TaxID=6269 RepID=A0A0M3JUM1_ANISI|nr:unnamed protein product [Anisakis simplex]
MKPGQTQLPENFEWFSEQIAGHHPSVVRNGEREIGFIKEKGSELLMKPVQEGVRGQCEVAVYDRINEWILNDVLSRNNNNNNSSKFDNDRNRELFIRLAKFVPKYFGLKTIFIGPKEVQCLLLEDLTYRYKQPCTMDIKIGKVTYDPNSTPAKRRSETIKYPEQKIFGFRLLGYRMHCVEGRPPRVRDKMWGRSRTLENILEGEHKILSLSCSFIFLNDNNSLSEYNNNNNWQSIYHFYASSILIVYEACMDRPPRVCVRLIDFSHVFSANGLCDENYLFGLNNMVDFIEKFIDLKGEEKLRNGN